MKRSRFFCLHTFLIFVFLFAIFAAFSCTSALAACSHENEYVSDSYTTYEQIPGNDQEHYAVDCVVWSCRDCGVITASPETGTAYGHYRSHVFQNNRCTQCGYQKAGCSHSTTELVFREKYYTSDGPTYHTTGYVYRRVCSSCGVVVQEPVIDFQQERHTFNSNGECTKCHYEKESTSTSCSHSRTYEVAGNKTYEPIDGNSTHHNVVTAYNKVCNLCGSIVSTEDRVQTALHSFSGNTCTACGYSTSSGGYVAPARPTATPSEVYGGLDPRNAPVFVDGKLKASSIDVEIEYRYRRSGESDTQAIEVDALYRSSIQHALNSQAFYGLHYTIYLPQLAYERTYLTTIILRSPTGFAYTVLSNYEHTYPRYADSTGYTYWYCLGEEFFEALYTDHGTIPSGEYYADLYWNGMWVNTTPFYVYD